MQKINESCIELGYESKINEDYSGRHMYGETTTGVVIDNNVNLMSIIISCADLFVENGKAIFDEMDGDIKSDTMGRDQTIYY